MQRGGGEERRVYMMLTASSAKQFLQFILLQKKFYSLIHSNKKKRKKLNVFSINLKTKKNHFGWNYRVARMTGEREKERERALETWDNLGMKTKNLNANVPMARLMKLNFANIQRCFRFSFPNRGKRKVRWTFPPPPRNSDAGGFGCLRPATSSWQTFRIIRTVIRERSSHYRIGLRLFQPADRDPWMSRMNVWKARRRRRCPEKQSELLLVS